MHDAPQGIPKRTRLGALKALGAAVAGVAAGSFIGREETASASDGSALTAGSIVTAESQTGLTMDGTLPANTAAFLVQGASSYAAIEGTASSIGVLGNATTGVMGVGDVGGVFSGDANAIQLNPQTFAGPPTSNDHLQGDILVDTNGILWLCVAGGTPGTWIKISHGGVRLLSSPQRAYDSRNTGGIFGNGEARSVAVAGTVSGVPSNALGVVGNVTITNTQGGGFVTIWPTGQAQPTTSNINWSASNVTIANAFTIAVGSGGAISVVTVGTVPQTAHVIVDVAGYVL